jgi:hypothetical protein
MKYDLLNISVEKSKRGEWTFYSGGWLLLPLIILIVLLVLK